MKRRRKKTWNKLMIFRRVRLVVGTIVQMWPHRLSRTIFLRLTWATLGHSLLHLIKNNAFEAEQSYQAGKLVIFEVACYILFYFLYDQCLLLKWYPLTAVPKLSLRRPTSLADFFPHTKGLATETSRLKFRLSSDSLLHCLEKRLVS